MTVQDKVQLTHGGKQALQDFNTFFDFWKPPHHLVTYDHQQSPNDANAITLNSPDEEVRSMPQFYRWQDAQFFVPLLRTASTLNTSSAPIYDQNGKVAGKVVFDQETNALSLPFHFDLAVHNLQLEKYLLTETTQPLVSLARESFYSIKPIIPRYVQLAIRKCASLFMKRRTFPGWPVDINVELLQFRLLANLLSSRPDFSLPVLSFWPGGEDFCLVITHDVETQVGYDHLYKLVQLEKKYGFRSSWNFVPRIYKIEPEKLRQLDVDGFEVGIHGLYHDGKLFKSKELFLKQASEINQYIQEWNCAGFRSPSLIRKMDWISQQIHVEYDTSYPTTEWYGAQPGGCCTVFPFTYDGMVELPITLQQDQTLLEILEISPEKMVDHWLHAIKMIKSVHGMVLLNVHPDYIHDQRKLGMYETLLDTLRRERGYWHALPREVARWWDQRQKMQIEWVESQWVIAEKSGPGGKVMQATLDPKHPSQLTIHPFYPD